MYSRSKLIPTILSVVFCFIPGLLFAHESGDVVGGLGSGFSHPFTGLDHVAAMIAVGIWGVQLKQPAIWLLPVTFPVVMAFGAMLGVMGVPLPGIEIGIAVSAIVLGAMIAVAGILLIDALDDTILDSDEVDRYLKLPVLGVIRRIKETDGPVTAVKPRAPVSEDFRSLRTNIQFASVVIERRGAFKSCETI